MFTDKIKRIVSDRSEIGKIEWGDDRLNITQYARNCEFMIVHSAVKRTCLVRYVHCLCEEFIYIIYYIHVE